MIHPLPLLQALPMHEPLIFCKAKQIPSHGFCLLHLLNRMHYCQSLDFFKIDILYRVTVSPLLYYYLRASLTGELNTKSSLLQRVNPQNRSPMDSLYPEFFLVHEQQPIQQLIKSDGLLFILQMLFSYYNNQVLNKKNVRRCVVVKKRINNE